MANCLVVEDDPDIGESLSAILDSQGHEVRTAQDGKEGLAKIAEKLPDVILLDVEMPVLNGPDMAYELLVQDAGRELIPIILLSGVANLKKVAERVGTPYFLAKPCSVDVLLNLMQQALADKRAPVPRLREPA